jgi:glycosyltransferase involved in cell wall biosynthesis
MVVMVGNARPEKNQLFGLRAANAADIPDLRVRVYTDDATRLARAWASTPGADQLEVEFREGEEVDPQTMASAAILLHPSVSESLPRVVLEAVSQATWVVASDVGDTRAAVGQCGEVIPSNDLSAFAVAIRRAVRQAQEGVEPPRATVRGVPQYCDEFFGAVGVSL